MEKVTELLEERNRYMDKQKEEILTTTKEILKKIGIRIDYLGFKYLTTAMLILIENEKSDREDLKMMQLYFLVARQHKTTASKVEKAIRYTYEKINLNEYFNVSYANTNRTFLNLLKEEVLKTMKENLVTCETGDFVE